MEKVTIKDIARLTGLSKGTVDRVLHNREGVSKKSYAKVMKVIEELGYEPNIYASLLARHDKRLVVVILPHSNPGEFWELVEPGLAKAAESSGKLGVELRKVEYDQYDEASFVAVCDDVLAMAPSGVVLPPMFRDATIAFTARLRESGIPYIYIDSKPEGDEGYLAYFGLNMPRSGYLCADLLTDGNVVEEVAVVRIKRDKSGLSDPTVDRREGFLAYMKDHCPGCAVETIFVDPNDSKGIPAVLEDFFNTHPQTRHIATFNSRIHLIAPFLRKHAAKGFRVIGFDNLEGNMTALSDGLVKALITQHPDNQVAEAVAALTNLLVFGKAPSTRDNFIHMDILTRYNI